MMRVELLAPMKSKRASGEVGDIVDLPDNLGVALIRNKQAKPVVGKKNEKAIKDKFEKR